MNRPGGHQPIHLYVRLERDVDGYPPFETEELDAIMLGNGIARLLSAPVFAHGLARDDQVSVKHLEDGQTWVTGLHQPSGRSTMRVVTLDGIEDDQAIRLVERMGCLGSSTQFGVIAVDCPPEVSVNK